VPKHPTRRSCGVMDIHRQLLSTDPDYRVARSEIENAALAYQARETQVERRPVRRIPVVVHVVHKTAEQNISDAQIRSQIRVLNRDFRKKNVDADQVPAPFKPAAADARIQFRLATRDVYGHRTTGITRKKTSVSSFSQNDRVKSSRTGGADPWPASRYLNIWVCQLEGLLGYAQFPGGPEATDGVVILYTAFGAGGAVKPPFDKGRTATHEIGHWLNLFHIWGDDGTGCGGSDQVPDTPNQADENYGTPTFPQISCNNGPNGDMFMNYMDYTDDAAMYLFTTGQARRMNATLDGARKALFERVPRFPGRLRRSRRARPAVKKVQQRLRRRFHFGDIEVDGVYGPQTEHVVRTFQNHRRRAPWGLGVSGAVERRTWIALWS
jgi:pregnancy-associated plasma protein-A/putative peptidoglycan binding protein